MRIDAAVSAEVLRVIAPLTERARCYAGRAGAAGGAQNRVSGNMELGALAAQS